MMQIGNPAKQRRKYLVDAVRRKKENGEVLLWHEETFMMWRAKFRAGMVEELKKKSGKGRWKRMKRQRRVG